MDEAFVQDAEDDVNGDKGGENQNRLIAERAEESGGGTLERALNAWRHGEISLGAIDGVDGIAQGSVWSNVKGKSDDRELALMIQGEGGWRCGDRSEGAQRNLRTIGGAHVDVLERVWRLLELRIGLHYHAVLVQLRINRGDLALAEGVVKGV